MGNKIKAGIVGATGLGLMGYAFFGKTEHSFTMKMLVFGAGAVIAMTATDVYTMAEKDDKKVVA